MPHEIWNIAAIIIVILAGQFASAQSLPTSSPPTVYQLAREVLSKARYLLDEKQRARLEELNPSFEVAHPQQGTTQPVDKRSTAERAAAQAETLTILDASSALIRVSLHDEDREATSSIRGPIQLPGSSGALLVRIDAGLAAALETPHIGKRTAPSTVSCQIGSHDLSVIWTDPVHLTIAPHGTTWALVSFSNVPDGKTVKELELLRDGRPRLRVRFELVSPPKGRLQLRVVSDENDQVTPAMMRLTWQVDGNTVMPAGAIDFSPLFDNNGLVSGRRYTTLPGRLGGDWWCVPSPVDMSVSPGQYEIAVRRGLQHLPVFEAVTVESGQTVERTIRLHHWTDMDKLGWYSGDDHVHCRMLSDEDARKIVTWARAEDMPLVNIVKMGDIYRTYFEQRGFGKDYRVVRQEQTSDRDLSLMRSPITLSPGQECPRTSYLGHVLAMNTTSMVRDTDKYFLYDWVFENVHGQGGLTGYAHVHNDGFWVHCDMSMNIPRGRVDFAEILQFGVLGTPLYYAFLNLGCKLTASAGSDVPFGGTIGDTQMFAHIGSAFGDAFSTAPRSADSVPFSADAWFDAVRRGHTFVTNGPMIELRVDHAEPGDEIRVLEDRKVHVHARSWAAADRSPPASLEIVVHGDVVKCVRSSGGTSEELSCELELNVGHGLWLAARCAGADGTLAHTTPVYLIREGFRFWKYDAAGQLIGQMRGFIGDLERRMDAVEQMDDRTRRYDLVRLRLAEQAPELRKRIAAGKQLYADLEKTIERERPLRAQP